MSNISKHIGHALFYDESKEATSASVLRLTDNHNRLKTSVSNNDLSKINIGHKLNRIQKEIRFAQDNLNKYQKLTSREREIIKLLAIGNNNPKIAEQLFISRYTVEQHRKNINSKLSVKSFPQLMVYPSGLLA